MRQFRQALRSLPDEIVDRFSALDTVEDHVAKLRELEALGADQFNTYL